MNIVYIGEASVYLSFIFGLNVMSNQHTTHLKSKLNQGYP